MAESLRMKLKNDFISGLNVKFLEFCLLNTALHLLSVPLCKEYDSNVKYLLFDPEELTFSCKLTLSTFSTMPTPETK